MNDLIKQLEEVIDKKADNNEMKKELSTLVKMLKIGFEKKTNGMEKIPKLFACNDEKKIKKFYDAIGNQICALKVEGSFDLFSDYLRINHGIEVTFTSDEAPSIRYKKGKKFKKFVDLYTGYYVQDTPSNAKEAMSTILNSLNALTKEYNNETGEVKEILKSIIEKQIEHSPETVKTLDKILTNARIKAIEPEEVANSIEDKINLQQQAIDIIKKED